MTPIKQVEAKGLRLSIYQDTDAESPRQWSNLGTMACWHQRYELGDVQPKENPAEYLATLPKGSIVLPLFLYDHSGITMSVAPFSCPWDSGQAGYIHISPETIRKEYSVKRISKALRSRVEGCLRQEVATYDEYLTGDVYGFVLEKHGPCDCPPEEECEHWEHIDACWGFFGHDARVNGMADYINVPELLAAL